MTHTEDGPEIADDDAVGAVGAACLGELGWVGPSGASALAVVPLVLGGRPAVALPYAWADALRPLGEAGWAVLSLTDPRMTGPRWRACALAGRATLVDDVDGSVVVEQLLDQELRKHPPSRVLADSPLLRRENWWYVPRVLVQLELTRCDPLPPRTDRAGQAVLVTSRTEGLPRVDVVAVPDWTARPLTVRAVGHRVLPVGTASGRSSTAALLATDVSVPDVERWPQHLLVGHWRATSGEGGEFDVMAGPDGAPTLPGPLGLMARWRRLRDLERACRAGIAAAEARRH